MYRNLDFQDINGEIWKEVPNFEGKYMVSNYGRIKTIIDKRQDKRGWWYKKKPKIMKQNLSSTGYLQVTLNKKKYKVHRLVASAFLPKIENKTIINHKDFNPLNNNVKNLEWCTQKENVEWSAKHNKLKKYYYIDEEYIKSQFIKGIQAKTISKELNIPKYIITNFLHKNNIKRSKSDYLGKYNVSANTIRNEIKNNKTNKEISIKYNIPQNYVSVLRYKLKKKEK